VSHETVDTVINAVAVDVAQCEEGEDWEKLIAAKTMQYLARLRAEQPNLTESEVDDIRSAVVRGVLERLQDFTRGR
jgi:hypothetical protein